MKILYVTSEVAPFSKTGGLADVASALPSALAGLGHEVRVVTPRYGNVPRTGLRKQEGPLRLKFPYGTELGHLWERDISERHRVWFIEHPGYFERAGYYQQGGQDYPDNHRRFGFFAVAALVAAQQQRFIPDVVHLNDWQAALAAPALRRGFQGTPLGKARTLFTIHNLAYQGLYPKYAMEELGLPWDLFTVEGLEFYDQVNFLKAGLSYSDALSTVSPRYAREIQTPELGCGLDGALRQRAASLHGILNGIDVTAWDPARDRYLSSPFSAESLEGKHLCKRALLGGLGMPLAPEGRGPPLFGIVGRAADQKGFDILLPALEEVLAASDVRVVALTAGDERHERALGALAARFPRKLAVRIGFDEAMAHRIEAGADFFLMPSRYEPCGLNQMYSLRYGTLPIVRATGGLDDSVEDLRSPQGTGFKFNAYTPAALVAAIRRALDLYVVPQQLDAARRRGMAKDVSWAKAAQQYVLLYRSMVEPKLG
jgi:starch synthase